MPASCPELSSAQIPILSLKKLGRCGPEGFALQDLLATAASLDSALSQMGFVYITDHGISRKTIDDVFSESLSFFKLDLKEKMKYERDFESTFHGYTEVGGIVTPKDVSLELREFFDAALAECDEFSSCPYPDDKVPNFQPALKELMKEGCRVSKILLELLGISLLGLKNKDYFLNVHSNVDNSSIPTYSQIRTLYYPKVPEGTQAGTTRCAPHTDYGTLTLLFQHGVGGLEVTSAQNGEWIPATPIEDSILINVGDLLKIWSGGRYPSTVHQVIIPEEEIRRAVPRQSIAIFIKPDNGVLVSPAVSGDNGTEIESMKIDAASHFKKRTIEWRD